MSSDKKPKQPSTPVNRATAPKKGLPLFDDETMAKLIAEATAPGAVMADVARKWKTSEHNVYRWVRNWKRKQQPVPTIPSDVGTPARPSPAGGQYRLNHNESQELERLRAENERLYNVIGKLTVERDQLLKKNQQSS